MKETTANSHFDITVDCPYCNSYQYHTEELRHYLDYQELSADECDVDIECKECKKDFKVTAIYF